MDVVFSHGSEPRNKISDPKYREANIRESKGNSQNEAMPAMSVAGLESQLRLELVKELWKRVLQENETGISFQTRPIVF